MGFKMIPSSWRWQRRQRTAPAQQLRGPVLAEFEDEDDYPERPHTLSEEIQQAQIAHLERHRMEQRRVSTNHASRIPAPPTEWTEEDLGETHDRAYVLGELTVQRQLLAFQLSELRTPGWRVPSGLRNKWPMYATEAVTVDTPYGQVTIGRSLARVFDMGGWPDAETLASMVEEQSARLGGCRF